jgi:hypothetical protein
MDHNYHLKPHDYQMREMEMALLESDSDDDVEILSILAMEDERLKKERASTSHRGSIVGRKVIKRNCKAKKDFFMIILQIVRFFLLIYSEGGFG